MFQVGRMPSDTSLAACSLHDCIIAPGRFPGCNLAPGGSLGFYALFSWVFVGVRGCESGHGSGHGSDVGVGCWPDLARILIQIRANVFSIVFDET